MTHTKVCTGCNEIKLAIPEFFKERKGGRHGLEAKCHPCRLADQSARRERDKDKINAKRRSARVKNDHDKRSTRWLVNGQEPTEKLCKGLCGLVRPVSDFTIRGKKKGGGSSYRSECKGCVSVKAENDRNDNPKKYKEKRERQKLKKLEERKAKMELLPKIQEGYRLCLGCDKEKLFTVEFFGLNINRKHGLQTRCRDCMKKPKKLKWATKDGHKVCRGECGLELPISDFRTHRGKPYTYCKVCEYKRDNKDPFRRAINAIRNRINSFLFFSKTDIFPMLGCTQEELKVHLEKQFKPGMTWRNYANRGGHKAGWHIDHYYPLSKAIKQGPEVYAKACHYTNLRPMWAEENMAKHARIPKEFKNVEDFLKS